MSANGKRLVAAAALLAAAGLLTVLAAAAAAAAAGGPRAVRTAGGLLQGEQSADGITIYKGIPFAAAPVGDRRWRPPAPARPWKGVRMTRDFAPDCPQEASKLGSSAGIERPQSEDCLYLNVWTPNHSQAAKLPVMVWIYGGGFQGGSAARPLYDGTRFAQKGIVLVTINYRVGAFGFLAHPELSAESRHHTSGNYGILDQIAALQWVRKNAAAFGGDPHRVTIFGESAGSTSANILQASLLAKGLFARVIGESTSQMDAAAGLLGRQSLAQAEQQGVRFASSHGAGSLAELRRLPADALLQPHQFFWPLIADGYVLPGDVYAIFAAGKQNDVPLLVGSNSAEGVNLRVPWIKPETVEEKAAFTQLYPEASDPQAPSPQPSTDTVAWQMRSWAALQAKTGRSPAYLYWFDQSPPAAQNAPRGALHGAEIAYVFQNFDRDRAWTEEDRHLGELMSQYWVNFAKSADPNGPGLPPWPAYAADAPQVMEFSPTPHAVAAPRESAFQFVDAYFASRRTAAQAQAAAAQEQPAAAHGGIVNIDLSRNGPELAASVPGIALDPTDRSRVFVVWRFISIAKDSPAPNWQCHLSISRDGGGHFEDQILTWKMPDTPRCNAPYVDVAKNGDVFVGATLMGPSLAGAVTMGTLPFGRAVIKKSTDGGRTWLPAVSVIATDTPRQRFAPNPSIPEEAMRAPWDGARGVIDQDSGSLFVSGGYPAPPNGAAHSQRFFAVSDDGAQSFGLIRAYGNAEWPQRWDSHLIAAHGILAFSYIAGSAPVAGAACPCVIFASSTDNGATISRHLVGPAENLDTLVHYPPIAADPARSGAFSLGMISKDRKNVLVLVSADSGASWRPVPLRQPPEVAFTSRPALSFTPDSTLIAMWRGLHDDGSYDIYMAASPDGQEFKQALRISGVSSTIKKELATHYAVRGDFLEVAAADRNAVHAAWTDWRSGTEARVYYARVPLPLLLSDSR
jgi:para-nitrobenzyl esterase